MEESILSSIKSEPTDSNIPTKKVKLIEDYNMLDYHRQILFMRQQQFMSFLPIPPLHSPHHPSKTLSIPYPVTPQFSEQFSEPPVLQNPERVVRLSESQCFESTFQPNVALAPRKRDHKQGIGRSSSDHVMIVGTVIKQEQPEIKQEPPSTPPETPPERYTSPTSRTTPSGCLNNDSASPETSQSGSNEITSSTSPVPAITNNTQHSGGSASNADTLLVSKQEVISPPPPVIRGTPVATDNIHHRSQASPILEATGNRSLITSVVGTGELELSTDTDDESVVGEPDSSSRHWDLSPDLLIDLRPEYRNKLLGFVNQLIEENNVLKRENLNIKRELQTRDSQIEQLLQKTDLQQQQQQQVDHYESTTAHSIKVVEPSVIAASTRPQTNSGHEKPIEHRNGFVDVSKATSEIIIKPFKKSLRRSPEDTVVIMQPKRDEIKILTNGELIRSIN